MAAKDNPQLKKSKLKDGRISLYLEYYLGRTQTPVLDDDGEPVLYDVGKMKGKPKYKVVHDRKKESLNLYILAKPRTPFEREQNKETWEIARGIRIRKEQELKEGVHGYKFKKNQDINFIDYFQSYLDNYTKKDVKMIKTALQRFKDFLAATPEYRKYTKMIKPQQIDKDMIEAYTEYLQTRSKGEGAHAIYARFKKVIKYAIEHDVMIKNPCTGVVIKIDDQQLKKDVLSIDEIQTLIATHYDNENPNIRRAFIFCLYTGLRFCDVKDLTFANVDFANKLLKFEQNKTKGNSANSGVVIPLNDGLLGIIGEPVSDNRDEVIFPLPTYEMCLKSVGRWVKRAGINKHISWHCARHSFAVNILNNGANIKTVASLLGHSGLKHTEKYTRAVDSLKKAAIDSLPELKF